MKTEPKIKWFASSGNIQRCGPFETQYAAFQAMRLTNKARDEQRRRTGSDSPYPVDMVTWPENAA